MYAIRAFLVVCIPLFSIDPKPGDLASRLVLTRFFPRQRGGDSQPGDAGLGQLIGFCGGGF